MNIYLDVDGVLLTKQGEPAEGVVNFLRHLIENHSPYWLTTHCKGDPAPVVAHLKWKLLQEAHQYLETIKPTNWDVLKTDGIDFSQDFLWFDDYLMESEKRVLEANSALQKQVLVDLRSNPRFLIDALKDGL